MPCGGISPVQPVTHREARCFHCGLSAEAKALDHFVEEWDAYMHRECVASFLLTPEGKLVLDHGHEVVIGEVVQDALGAGQ